MSPVQHQIEGEDHHTEHCTAQHRELPAQLHRAALPPPRTVQPRESSAPAPVGGGTAATALLRRGSPERSPEKCEKSPPAPGTEHRAEPRAAAGGEPAVSGSGSGSGCTRQGSGGGTPRGRANTAVPRFPSSSGRSAPPRHRQVAPESGTSSPAPRPERCRRRAHAPRRKEPPPASTRPRRRRSAALRPHAGGRCRVQVTRAAPPPLPPRGSVGSERTAPPWGRGGERRPSGRSSCSSAVRALVPRCPRPTRRGQRCGRPEQGAVPGAPPGEKRGREFFARSCGRRQPGARQRLVRTRTVRCADAVPPVQCYADKWDRPKFQIESMFSTLEQASADAPRGSATGAPALRVPVLHRGHV